MNLKKHIFSLLLCTTIAFQTYTIKPFFGSIVSSFSRATSKLSEVTSKITKEVPKQYIVAIGALGALGTVTLIFSLYKLVVFRTEGPEDWANIPEGREAYEHFMNACRNGNIEKVKFLEDRYYFRYYIHSQLHGTFSRFTVSWAMRNIRMANDYEVNPFNIALQHGRNEVADYLAEKFRKGEFYSWHSYFREYIDAGDLNHIRYFVEKLGFTLPNDTIIGFCKNGHLDIIKYLMEEKDIDINVIDDEGKDLVTIARENEHQEIEEYLLSKNEETKKAWASIENNDLKQHLKDACREGNFEKVKYLVEDRNAMIEISDDCNHVKIAKNNRSFNRNSGFDNRIYFYLREKVIGGDALDSRELLVEACREGDFNKVKFIVEEHGIIVLCNKGLTRSSAGWQSMCIAAAHCRHDIFFYLANKCANHDWLDEWCWLEVLSTALMRNLSLVDRIYDQYMSPFNINDLLDICIEHDLVSNCFSVIYEKEEERRNILPDKNLLLYKAGEKEKLDIMKYLIEEKDADINTRNNQNKSLLDLAREKNNREIEEYLISKGAKERENTFDVTECSICLDKYDEDESVTILPCEHIFHRQCLLNWFNQKEECPLCKREYEEDDFRGLKFKKKKNENNLDSGSNDSDDEDDNQDVKKGKKNIIKNLGAKNNESKEIINLKKKRDKKTIINEKILENNSNKNTSVIPNYSTTFRQVQIMREQSLLDEEIYGPIEAYLRRVNGIEKKN